MEKIESTTAEAVTTAPSAIAQTQPLDAALNEKDFFEKAFNKEESEAKPAPAETPNVESKEKPKEESPTDNQGGDTKEQSEAQPSDNQGGDTKEQNKEQPKEAPHKKSAREKVQQAVRAMKQYREEAEAKAIQIEALQKELDAIRAKKPEELSVKEQVREAVIEDRLYEENSRVQGELNNYLTSIDDPIEKEKFEVDYDDHIPKLMKDDPWTVKTIGALPEKYDILKELFNAISNKQFTLQDWMAETRSVKLAAIDRVRKKLRGELKQEAPKQTQAAPQAAPKKLPDSVVPDDLKHSAEPPVLTQEAAFRKAFHRG